MMPPSRGPRVALCGINLESNAFSPMATESDFRSLCYLEGDDLLRDARSDAPRCAAELTGFISAMDVTGPWLPVPLVFTRSHPSGPVEQSFFDHVVDVMRRGIQAFGGVDAVYVANHGAMLSSGSQDPDGDMFEALREAVGAHAPIVGTLDLHANVSARVADTADLLVAYTTNPHVDQFERGEEAAHALRAILGGAAQPHSAYIKLPIAAPAVTLLTRSGPYADLIDFGARRKRELGGAILNVSMIAGFVYGDGPNTGMSVLVTGRRALAPAQSLAREIATRAWDDRARFQRALTPLDEALESALARGTDTRIAPAIYSDAGDNPGGGGGGDTMTLLRALVDGGARGVLFGAIFDTALAADALEAGVGAEINAEFNRAPATRFSDRWQAPARVRAVSTDGFVGRLGLYAGIRIDAAPSCALEIGGPDGIVVVVISSRYQCADPMFFEHLGLDIARARTVCVKSRGHFRAGFEPFFPPEQVFEVDTPGLTSPVLSRFDWSGLARPIYPLDADTDWVPPNA